MLFLDHFKKYQIKPDHQKNVNDHADVEDHIEELGICKFIFHGDSPVVFFESSVISCLLSP